LSGNRAMILSQHGRRAMKLHSAGPFERYACPEELQ